MVLVERNAENVRNGRRSRGPSPNGHNNGTPDTSSDDDSTKKIGNKTKTKSEYEEKIRVGRDYQVVCPDFIPTNDRKPDTLSDRALLVWSPTKDIPECKLEEYISVAKEKYGYNGEQALGMLFWHKHDLERAVLDLSNFTPFPDEWTVEDKVLFEQAFQFHGKSFHRIRQMLPDKSIASLVKYYYSWKKTRSRTSVMDRQEKIKTKEGSENGSENGSNEESDTEEKKWPLHRGIRRASGSPPPRGSNDEHNSTIMTPTNQAGPTTSTLTASSSPSLTSASTAATTSPAAASILQNGVNSAELNNSKESIDPIAIATVSNSTTSTNSCFGCGVACSYTNLSPHGALCNSCFHHWRRTGALRPTSGPCYGKRSRGTGFERHKRKPPRGMYINHDDIVSLACPDNVQSPGVGGGGGPTNPNRNDDLLASMDREIISLLSQIQTNKQTLSTIKRKNSEQLSDIDPIDTAISRISSRWTNEELLLGVQGIRKYGKHFQEIAEMIGTKTEAHVRTFFINYRRRYSLDSLLKEHDAMKEQATANNGQTNLDANTIKQHEPEIMEIDLDDENPLKEDDDIEEVIISEKETSILSPLTHKTTRIVESADSTAAASNPAESKMQPQIKSIISAK